MTNGKDPISMDVTESGTMGGTHGLTKREYFAAMAMQGMIDKANWLIDFEYTSKQAVIFADALINALNQTK